MRASIRVFLALPALALAAATAVAVLALGLPVAARHALGPAALGAIAAAAAALVLALALVLLFRGVAPPPARLPAAAARLGPGDPAIRGELPILGEPGGLALS